MQGVLWLTMGRYVKGELFETAPTGYGAGPNEVDLPLATVIELNQG